MLPHLFLAGALALPSVAFLVVPEVHPLDPRNGRHLELEVKCAECPFPSVQGSEVVWSDKADGVLDLNFTTENGRLSVNNKQVFPLPEQPVDVEAVVHRQPDGQASPPIHLGYAFELLPTQASNDVDAKLVTFLFTVIEVSGYPVPIDPIQIAAIQAKGDLFLVNAEVAETPRSPISWRDCRRGPKCLKDLLIARIGQIMAAAKARAHYAASRLPFKGCHGKKPAHGAPAPGNPNMAPQQGSHGMNNYHAYHSGFARAFSRALRSIVVPAVLGLSAGVIACSIGMLIGRGIAALWIRCRRGSSRQIVDAEQGDEVEKEPLVDEEDDFPPEYDDAAQGKIQLPAEKE